MVGANHISGDELRHWWVEIGGNILEFAKGTLCNGVHGRYGSPDVGDLSTIIPPNGFQYIKI